MSDSQKDLKALILESSPSSFDRTLEKVCRLKRCFDAVPRKTVLVLHFEVLRL